MNYADISTSLNELGVTPPDLMRAALYLDYLTQAQTAFTSTFAKSEADGGLGADAYAFVEGALTSNDLLDALAVLLDDLTQPAVQGQMTKAGAPTAGGYDAYFSANILPTVASGQDITEAQFQTNLQSFFAAQPITKAALAAAIANFIGNIHSVCARVFADLEPLELLYQDQFDSGFHLLSLKRIAPAGTAFLNGGQQVLDLQFVVSGAPSDSSIFPKASFGSTIWITYEPRDLEMDCLIGGVTTAVNRAVGSSFQTNALIEIYNKAVAANTDSSLTSSLTPLPTLLILPRNPSSTTTPPIKKSYGYRQSLTAPPLSPRDRARSTTLTADALIPADADATTVASAFYLTLGAICALSCTFSVTELSSRRVIAQALSPKLPNTSAAMITSVAGVGDTGLFAGTTGDGGVDGQTESAELTSLDADGSQLVTQTTALRTPNRLWRAATTGNVNVLSLSGSLSPTPAAVFLQGFDAGVAILKTVYTGADKALVDGFISRTDHVAVTVPAITAQTAETLRQTIFMDLPRSGSSLTLEEACDTTVSAALSAEYAAYKAAGDTAADPAFIGLSPLLAGKALTGLDTPSFYHQIGTQDLLAPDGTVIPIPASITAYLDPRNPSATTDLPVKGATGFPTRDTYFAADPSSTRVVTPQIKTIGTSAGDARAATLRSGLQKAMGLSAGFSPGDVVTLGAE